MRGAGRHRVGADPPRGSTRPGRPHRVYLVLCVVLLGAAALLAGRYFQQSPPPPAPPGGLGAIPAAMTASAEPGTSRPGLRDPEADIDLDRSPAPAPPPPPPPFHLAPSPPTSVRASAVGIDSPLVQVGLHEDGTIEVPSTYDKAAWYRLGPPPGALGPAVIIGHVDSYRGPGVFFNVGAMRPGQVISVTRADKSIAQFRVDAVNSYPKNRFPTEAVYGPINYAGLRLITCGGTFDEKTRSYESNVVVYASLLHP